MTKLLNLIEVKDTDWTTLYHIPFEITWDDSTLCWVMSDCWLFEWIESWEWVEWEEITCKQCKNIFKQYESIRKNYIKHIS